MTARKRLVVRAGIVLLPVALFALLRPGPFLVTIRSPQALVRIAAIVAGLMLLSWLLRRFIATPWLRQVLVAVPATALLWLTVLPYFYGDKTAHRTLADAAAEHAPEAPTSSPASAPPSTPSAAVAPVLLRTGSFHGIGHRASGRVSLYRLADSTVVIQLDEIDIQSGPDYDLYIVPGADREDRDGGVRLGDLRANKGSDNYVFPDGSVALDQELTVLVWCQTFSVPVAGATQLAA
jgi:hypothetical protein